DYIVEYDYDAVHDDELTIRVGEIIRNVKKLQEEGWLEGELNGRRGMFPDNFVKEIKRETEPKDDNLPIKRERHGNVASLVQRISTYGLPAGGIQPHPQTKSIKKKTKKRQCKVLFDYLPQNEDELELTVGDIIDINEEVEEGWWSGTLNNKLGLFPSNFVKELELADDGETHEGQDESEIAVTGSTSPLLSPGNASETAPGSVTQPKKIRGVGFGDIFKEGSPLILQSLGSRTQNVEETGEAGWWKGELSGREGVFPDNFAVEISELDKDFPKPKKPPPPVKGPAPKPDLLAAEKKVFPLKSEEKDEKLMLEQKPSKPAAPQVPPKKPTPPTKANNLLRSPGTVYPKRPDKPVPPPPPAAKINGEVSTISSKIETEPVSKPKLDPEQLPVRPKSVDFDVFVVRNSKETDFVNFDDIASSENLLHLTANRPKMPGRRLPGRFNGGHSPTQSPEKTLKLPKEDDTGGLKLSELKKDTSYPSKPSLSTPSSASKVNTSAFLTPLELKAKAEADDGKKTSLDEIRAQIIELLCIVDALKKDHGEELEKLRRELEEEKAMRNNLEVEIAKLKKAVLSS
ncbi:hypothetical protein A6R68_16736, partial [Neotoma lepida]